MLEIRKINETKGDIGFILYLLKKNKKKVCNDQELRRKISDSELSIVLSRKEGSRIIEIDGEYVGFLIVEKSENGLYAFIDGFINTTNSKYKKLVKDFNITDDIFKYIFNEFDVQSLIIYYNEWLYHKAGRKEYIKTKMVEILKLVGFKDVGMIRNYVNKDNNPKSVFILQISRGFFFKWKRIKELVEDGFNIEDIAEKYKTSVKIIKDISKSKKWSIPNGKI